MRQWKYTRELLTSGSYHGQFRKGRLRGRILKKQENSKRYSPVQTDQDALKSYFVDSNGVFPS